MNTSRSSAAVSRPALDPKAFKAAMAAWNKAIPGDISGGKNPLAAAINAYLYAAPKQAELLPKP